LQIASAYEDEEIRNKIQNAFPTPWNCCIFRVMSWINLVQFRVFHPKPRRLQSKKLWNALDEMDASCGYSSAACGTDIIISWKP
jgi:hypothetical protein